MFDNYKAGEKIRLPLDILIEHYYFWVIFKTFIKIYCFYSQRYSFLFLFLFLAVLGLRFCARAFSSCGKGGGTIHRVRGPLTIVASFAAEHRFQMCRLSGCGSRAQLLQGMWDLPRPGLEPMSSASAGRFSNTAPPGKPQKIFLYMLVFGGKNQLFTLIQKFYFNVWSSWQL